MQSSPTTLQLQELLDQQRPASLLALLPADATPPELAPYRAAALIDLDREREGLAYLEPLLGELSGEARAHAETVWAELQLGLGNIDAAVLAAERAERSGAQPYRRAAALGWAARGLALKRCWKLAEAALRTAIELAPADIEVMFAQARVALLMDQRVAARSIYERIAVINPVRAAWGLATVAFLLGEFAIARAEVERAVAGSQEAVGPLFLRGEIELALQDLPKLEQTIAEIERRSPLAESLPAWRRACDNLRRQLAPSTDGSRARLTAFPTVMQRRDHCGPCTVELVLRFWRGGLDMTNDQIAQAIKFPDSGTPMYKMREFFHLVGFDTLRCRASIGQLKRLIDAGYPVIVEEQFPNSAHVAVVIGYDDHLGALIFQDPMTHIITLVPIERVQQLRQPVLDSALVAFPAGHGHDKTLALMDCFDDPTLIWFDQAALASDAGRLQEATALAAQAVTRQPAFRLGWDLALAVELRQWEQNEQYRDQGTDTLPGRLVRIYAKDPLAARDRVYATLTRAARSLPEDARIHFSAARAALLDRDTPRALAALERARELEPEHAPTLALLAACWYSLRSTDQALQAAEQAVAHDGTLAAANAWLARCLARSDGERAYHHARCAAEQAPDWWLTHLALGEAELARSDVAAARRAAGIALGLAPSEPEARAFFAVVLASAGDTIGASIQVEELLAQPEQLTPAVAYRTRQVLSRILFGAELYDEAATQARALLALAPDDAWALQHLAAAYGAARRAAGQTGDPAVIDELRQLYASALAAHHGEPAIARAYLDDLGALAGWQAASEAAAELCAAYPQRGLSFLRGLMLARADLFEPAAGHMLDALTQSEGIASHDDLHLAVAAVLDGRGLEAGAAAILTLPETGAVPSALRRRMLGLLLAQHQQAAAQASELLEAVVAADPNDASATLRLGEVSESDETREALFRRALLLAPRWSYARYRLARLLLDQDRIAEALEFTSGHASETVELNELHGRALLFDGRAEEAAAVYAQVITQLTAPPGWLYYYKWRAESGSGLHDTAAATAQQAIERFADEPSWYVQLGSSLASQGDYAAALMAAEHGRAAGLAEVSVLEIDYQVAWARHDLPATLAVIEHALELAEPAETADEPGHWQRRRLRLLLDLGRLEEAREYLAGQSLSASGWGQAAWVAVEAESWPLAIEFAERALQLNAEDFAGLFTHATALRELERETEAVAAFDLLRRAHPNEHNAYEKLGLLAALDERLDEALELADRALALGPFCYLAWATRGYVAFVRGEDDKALADLETGWRRANVDQRRGEHAFWWVRCALRGDQQAAFSHREQAQARARTAHERRQIEQITALLRERTLQIEPN